MGKKGKSGRVTGGKRKKEEWDSVKEGKKERGEE